MTKPLLIGSIKRSKNLPTTEGFDLILQGISDNDKIGHLFIVGIKFDHKNASEKDLFFNEIYTPIFLKKKVLSVKERSVSQLLNAMRLNDKGTNNSYKPTAKSHATIDARITIPLYVEHLHLLTARCGWKVKKVRGP